MCYCNRVNEITSQSIKDAMKIIEDWADPEARRKNEEAFSGYMQWEAERVRKYNPELADKIIDIWV